MASKQIKIGSNSGKPILDWKCVKFKNGYFVVVPPVDIS